MTKRESSLTIIKLMTVQRKRRSFISGQKKALSSMRNHLTLIWHGKYMTD
nr:MAG TPA: hypothetical protein [Bacteriophage sp.]